jgi:lipoate-protein ligase A
MGAVCETTRRAFQALGVDAAAEVERPGASRIAWCLAEPSPYAILIGSRKAAGFALRRFARAWLVEGSVLLRPLPDALRRALPAEELAALEARAIALEEAAGRAIPASVLAQQWSDIWRMSWEV